MADLTRRKWLTGQVQQTAQVIRPPWSVSESHFLQQCHRCHKCIDSCETQVLKIGRGGYPEVDFQQAECSFCRQCIAACDADVFDSTQTLPWNGVAEPEKHCLAMRHIACRTCQDYCEYSAIRFQPALGGVAFPHIDHDLCRGCGACISPCPVQAMHMKLQQTNSTTGSTGNNHE